MTEEELLEQGIITIPVETLLEYWDPILDDVWSCGVISEDDIRNCTDFSAVKPAKENSADFYSYEYNVSRIAYLLKHGWEASDTDTSPVTIDVGLQGYTPFELLVDGNHRLAAAKIRGDEFITVSVIGDIRKAQAVFLQGVYIDDY